MICKNRVLLLAFCMVMTEPGRAQTELTQITSASDSTELVDGGLYLFSSDVVSREKEIWVCRLSYLKRFLYTSLPYYTLYGRSSLFLSGFHCCSRE